MSLTLASKITVGRIVIVPFFILTVIYYSPDRDFLRVTALAIFLGAMALDVLDGYVARTFDQESKIGAILDPLADKIFLISTYICLYIIGESFPVLRFPIWLVVMVVGRDVVLLLGAAMIHLTKGELIVKPTVWGKAAVFFEVLAVIGLLLQWPLSSYIWYVILLLVIISGLDYVMKGLKDLHSEGTCA